MAGFWASLKRIARGDIGPIVERMDRHVARAEAYIDSVDDEDADNPEHGPARPRPERRHAKDIAIITGLALTMLGIKALKLLPNIPFAPGHKFVVLTPLYIVATLRTRTRFGATLTGLVMGSIAFLMGDGKYGIFEIAKHVVPGMLCDLLVPLVVRLGRGKPPGAAALSIVGGVMGLGRFATNFMLVLMMQAPALAWAFFIPGLLAHTVFGVLSGFVSTPLIRALARRKM
jgi:hypothetical protein